MRIGLATLALIALAACGGGEGPPLPGERQLVRPLEDSATGAVEKAPALRLGTPQENARWTREGGAADGQIGHVALDWPLSQAWSVDIGRGGTREGRLTGAPVMGDNRIFALDAAGMVTALSADGAVLWQQSLTPDGEDELDGFGGGLALGDGVLAAGTGYGEVIALEPDTGEIRWRQDVDAPVRAAPTVAGNRIYAVARNDTAYALDVRNGRIRWQSEGIAPGAGILGGASPAASSNLVVVPFASGEAAAMLVRNGRRVWSTLVTGGRRGLVRGRLSDITGDPVIAGGRVYLANQSGRFVALDLRSGRRIWEHGEGAMGPALEVGNAVFVVSDQARVSRLNRATGEIIWSRQLPEYEDAADLDGAITHSGPILAGDALLIASSDGLLRRFDPATGADAGTVSLPSGAAAQPAIAGGQLVVLTKDGALVAYR